ncbi:MAG: hypothetical protein JWN25_700 [Verrucomicrobiales bacterium]|jgi:uncharacterized protein YdeI (BOF family)|nr:hypothetical protein [Verrucomicrobiales bacterium]
MTGWKILVLLIALAVTGCNREGQQGKMEGGPVYAISELVNTTNIPEGTITVIGEMVEKCNVSGCWFYLATNNSRIKVDIKNAGFSATDVPLHSKVQVSAKLHREGDAVILEAAGMKW